jgi:hypothetical protein
VVRMLVEHGAELNCRDKQVLYGKGRLILWIRG